LTHASRGTRPAERALCKRRVSAENGTYPWWREARTMRFMTLLRRLLNPVSTWLTDWWCHLGIRTTGTGVTVVVSERQLDDNRNG
jgi:hypothetical protein